MPYGQVLQLYIELLLVQVRAELHHSIRQVELSPQAGMAGVLFVPIAALLQGVLGGTVLLKDEQS